MHKVTNDVETNENVQCDNLDLLKNAKEDGNTLTEMEFEEPDEPVIIKDSKKSKKFELQISIEIRRKK